MNSQILTYLRRKKLTDTRIVNRLFVSAFILSHNLKVRNNRLIKQLTINEEDEDFHILQEFVSKIQKLNPEGLTIENLITLFEFVVSPADRIITGAIYTPLEIRKNIIQFCLGRMTIKQLKHIRLADISCGCGGFLVDVSLYLHEKTNRSFIDIYHENIYGIDIQGYSVERTQIILSLLALLQNEDENFHFNILKADTLDFNTKYWDKKYSNFHVIVGNPPYVCSRNVDAETKIKMLRYEVCQSGHPDLYMPFFQIAIDMLLEGGYLGFITMNSFIRSVNGRSLRKYLSSGEHDIYVIDFRGRQIFNGKSTYTCLFYLTKKKQSNQLHYFVNDIGKICQNPRFIDISYSSLDNKKGWFLNDINNISKLESVGTPIAQYCQSRHGIATLSNKIYIFNPISENDDFYFLEKNGKCFPIEKGICRNIVNSNKLNSKVLFKDIIEKLIFPYYINNKGNAVIIEENQIKIAFPYAYEYLKTQRNVLNKRDKGNTEGYPTWYAYGRTQSLVMPRYKLFYPKFANRPLHCVLQDDANLMLYNGIAFVSDDIEKLQILKCILESDLFWNYVVKNAKPYASGYYSLSGVDIKKFGIPHFSYEEKISLLSIKDKEKLEKWLYSHYH